MNPKRKTRAEHITATTYVAWVCCKDEDDDASVRIKLALEHGHAS